MSPRLSFGVFVPFLVFVTVLAWTVDYRGQFGAEVQSVVDLLRWGCIAAGFMLATWQLLHSRTINRRLAVGMVVIVALILPSVFTSSHLPTSIIEFVRTVSILPIVLLVDRETLRRRHAIVIALISALSVVVVISMLTMTFNELIENLQVFSQSGAERVRFKGITPHANILAYLSAQTACYCLCLSFGRWSTVGIGIKCSILVLGLCSAMICVSTGSRTGVGWLVTMPVLLWLLSRVKKPSRKTAQLVLATGVLALISVPTILITSHMDVILAASNVDSFSNSNAERIAAWHSAWSNFLSDPLLGKGLANGVAVDVSTSPDTQFRYAHNALLSWISDSGIFGGIAIIVVLLALSKHTIDGFLESECLSPIYRTDYHFGALTLLGVIVFATIEGALQGIYCIAFIAGVLYGSVKTASNSSTAIFTASVDD